MDYTAEIIIREDPDNIHKCLLPEIMNRDRSTIKITKEKDVLKVLIEAKDAVAFRATMNHLTQTIAVYSKSKNI